LNAQYKEIKDKLNGTFAAIIKRGDFILGKEVVLFEKEFSAYTNRKFAIGVNSGTDAIFLGLLSLGIGKGDEVIVPAFTYIATAFAVSYTGARPVFVDIDRDTYNIDANKISAAITKRTKAIMPVHLYGQAADMKPILEIAKTHKLKIIEDAAQAHGAKYKNLTAGSIGDIGCFSFYPTKNLGGFGDGGLISTDNPEIYKRLFKLRDYGRKTRYEHVSLGYNSRLDTLQAAVLSIKLKHLEKWNNMRRKNAKIYNDMLRAADNIITPKEADYARHIYHVYAIRVKDRDKVVNGLRKKGISAIVHYPVPLHLQEVFSGLGYKNGDFTVSEKTAHEVISLPMYPHLSEGQIKFIAETLIKITKD
jgi:dTDP-4-amino-4,6-dideoxygalactose transaminase